MAENAADDSPLPSSFDNDPDFFDERRWHKFVRKLKEEPLLPIGGAVTIWALRSASKNIRAGGDPNVTNRFFRYRIYAQFFTIVAMLGGAFYYNADRFKRSEYRKLIQRQKEQEKRERWIRELEARDAEDSEWRARLGKIKSIEQEIEEKRLVEEKRARDNAAQAKQPSDNVGVLEAIKMQKNAAKPKPKQLQVAGQSQKDAIAEPILPVGPQPTSVEPATAQKSEEEQFKPTFGESQEGGLLGIGWLKRYYEHLTKDSKKEKK